jgi:hypothetical protein
MNFAARRLRPRSRAGPTQVGLRRHDERNRRKGPPSLTLRGLAPLLVFFTLAVFTTGATMLLLGSHSRGSVLILHRSGCPVIPAEASRSFGALLGGVVIAIALSGQISTFMHAVITH